MSKALTENDFAKAAIDLGVPVAAIKAVTEVESAGSGFLADGRIKVQYEPHIMYRQLRDKFGQARADAELAKHPQLVAKAAGSYKPLNQEDQDMDQAARLIDRECALNSASWGMFQIMGYHWKTMGYPSQQAFINAMYSGAAGHLDSFVRFVKADGRLVKALRALDWAGFARVYNGPAYEKNRYHTKMADAFKRAGGVS